MYDNYAQTGDFVVQVAQDNKDNIVGSEKKVLGSFLRLSIERDNDRLCIRFSVCGRTAVVVSFIVLLLAAVAQTPTQSLLKLIENLARGG